MPKNSKIKTDHFLNRLALEKMADPYSIDPWSILTDIFEFGGSADMQEMLRIFCAAALTEKFTWKEGTPGNLLFFSERLEKMIEACFLIHAFGNDQRLVHAEKKHMKLKEIRLPTCLSEKEWTKPLIVLREFFDYSSLPEWKLALHSWMEAALSKYSVVESIEPPDLLPFSQYLGKLVEAAYLLAVRSRKVRK